MLRERSNPHRPTRRVADPVSLGSAAGPSPGLAPSRRGADRRDSRHGGLSMAPARRTPAVGPPRPGIPDGHRLAVERYTARCSGVWARLSDQDSARTRRMPAIGPTSALSLQLQSFTLSHMNIEMPYSRSAEKMLQIVRTSLRGSSPGRRLSRNGWRAEGPRRHSSRGRAARGGCRYGGAGRLMPGADPGRGAGRPCVRPRATPVRKPCPRQASGHGHKQWS